MKKVPTILAIEEKAITRWFSLLKKTIRWSPEQEPQDFFSIKPHDYIGIIAQTELKEWIIIQQYRPTIENFSWEFPAGLWDDKDQDSLSMAKQELLEETGYEAAEWFFLGQVRPDTGRLANTLHVYGAKRARPTAQRPEELINEVRLITDDKLQMMIVQGEFNHAQNLAALSLWQARQYDGQRLNQGKTG